LDLRRRAFGLAFGIMVGLFFSLTTCWFLLMDSRGDFFSKLSLLFLGYTFSWQGAAIAFFWGFIYGFFFGAFLAWLYNVISRLIYNSSR
jgi:hypothetical protein